MLQGSRDPVVETMVGNLLKKHSLQRNLRYNKWIDNFTEAFS
jgi:hypothetical protein